VHPESKMSIEELESAIAHRVRSLDEMVRDRSFGPDYRRLRNELLELERSLAGERRQEHVLEISLGDAWNGTAYSPVVIGGAFDCVIAYATKDGRHAAIGFRSIAGYKLTDVSDEILAGHRLTGRGLAAYRAFEVRNSTWIEELESVDRFHPQHSSDRWRTSRHYLLSFKDRMFEAISSRIEVVGIFSTSHEAVASAQSLLKLGEAS
jgi:hypothetical protein